MAETNPTKIAVQIMVGDLFPVYSSGSLSIFILDTNGADRNVTPKGSFPEGYEIQIVNVGDEMITFDPSGANKDVSPRYGKQSFYYTGTSWR